MVEIAEMLLAFSIKFEVPVLKLHGFGVLGIPLRGISGNGDVYWDIYSKLKLNFMIVKK